MNWSVIKNFGKVKYFNISYIILIVVPLLANIFQFLNKEFSYHLGVPPMVKTLYVASILYAIGIAIYQYRCPGIIKEYENKQAYIKDNIAMFMNKAPDLKFHIVLAQLNKNTQAESYKELTNLYTQLRQETSADVAINLRSELDNKLNLLYEGSVQSHLETKFDTENKQEPVSYWLSGIFYCAGTLIILILLILRTLIVFNT